MDLSVQPRILVGAHRAPVLRVVETSRLLLHEHPDGERVRRLVGALRRDGVLRNPPIVTSVSAPWTREPPADDEQAVVLDGANRVTALREIGVPAIAVQLVHYAAPEITVSTWRHYVVEEEPSVRSRLMSRPSMRLAPASGAAEAEARLGRRDGVAALADRGGVAVVGPGIDAVAEVERLNELIRLYSGAGRVHRVLGGDLEALRTDYGEGTLVIFPPFGKGDILRLAAGGGRLPAGITRHLVPGRVLRLNVPLEWLQGPEPAALKQRRLDGAVQERWRAHGVRYYPEATYLFDE